MKESFVIVIKLKSFIKMVWVKKKKTLFFSSQSLCKVVLQLIASSVFLNVKEKSAQSEKS